jgi:predicted nuclease of predicted toxin-antitoxin system
MRILLDENVPRQLRGILPGHDVRTAAQMGWARYSNGHLLDEAEKAGFDALVTADQNFAFQQSLTGRNIAVVVLSTNRLTIIRTQPQAVQRAVATATPGAFTFATIGRPSRRPRRPPTPTC